MSTLYDWVLAGEGGETDYLFGRFNGEFKLDIDLEELRRDDV